VAVSQSGVLSYNKERNTLIVELADEYPEDVSLAESDGFIRDLALSPDLQYMVAGLDGKAIIYSTNSAREITTIKESAPERTFQDHYMAFSPDGKYYAYITPKLDIHFPGSTSVVLVSVSDWLESARFYNEDAEIHAFAFSSDSLYLATADNKPEIVIWDITTGQAIRHFKSPFSEYAGQYLAVAISPDNNYVAASRDRFWGGRRYGVIEFWDLKNDKYLFLLDKRGDDFIAWFESGRFSYSEGAKDLLRISFELKSYTLNDFQKLFPEKLYPLIVYQKELVEPFMP
jgi:WD40 repeat protein